MQRRRRRRRQRRLFAFFPLLCGSATMAGRHSDDGQLAAQQESMSISHLIRRPPRDGRTDSHIKCELESVDTFIALGGGRAGDRVFQVGRRGLGRQAESQTARIPNQAPYQAGKRARTSYFTTPGPERSKGNGSPNFPIPAYLIKQLPLCFLPCARHMPFIPPLKRWNA